MKSNLRIVDFTADRIHDVKVFTDRAIGENYYSLEELEAIQKRSVKNNIICSLLLEEPTQKQLYGVRITYPATQWEKGKGKGLSQELWKSKIHETAYFQSLFVDPKLTGHGWGKKLSLAAIDKLKTLQTKAIVTHSWKESPNDSSGRYLRALGFHLVATHPLYWHEVDYVCTRCGKPCLCTAEEMIKYLAL